MSTGKVEGSNHSYSHIKTEPCPGESKAKLHKLMRNVSQSHKDRVKSLISRASSVATGGKGLASITKRTFKGG